ncbi:TPA: hypothetical protein ACF31N_004407 [Vibrio parahaemolyticus]|nr:hypothetical protein [Vibrio parahaemolyticus]
MFDFGSVGNVASILGLVVAIAVALYQREVALKAEREAKAEREKAATLEDHLLRQRWQQLRSLGEQIDQIERENSQATDPASAALHARLKEQYASILGVIAASTKDFSVALIRRWVNTGRLFRTWQISEALTYVNIVHTDESNLDDEKWLREIIERTHSSQQQIPQSLQLPIELNEFVAAYIILSGIYSDFIKSKLGSGQQNYSVVTVLGYLANDCLEKSNNKFGGEHFQCWGWKELKDFEERYDYYQKLDFWVVCTVSRHFQSKLSDYANYFEDVGSSPRYVLPTNKAFDEAKMLFPELYGLATNLLNNDEITVYPVQRLEKI